MEIHFDDIEIFKNNISSLKETSIDTDSDTIKYMTHSNLKVINFDKVKEDYIQNMKLSDTPCSSDALYINNKGMIYFIEFKNGVMNKSKVYNVHNKIYDSLLIFNDIIGQNISFCREHVNFILVYNENKNPLETNKCHKEDSSKASIGKYFTSKAKKKYIRFDLGKFEKIYFKNVFTFTEHEFEQDFLTAL